ncbi:MAG: DUF126 domain-containing protein [Archaeoglobaceae archaeon]|nr:DUF126 domain-containing protein [Archaeoglobaceae archaeon]
MKFKCRGLFGSKAFGEALVSKKPISFFGDVNEEGIIVSKDSDIFGRSIENKVLIFPYSKGSTVGSYVILQLKKKGKAPLAIVNRESEIVVAAGAVLANIVLVDRVEENFFEVVKSGDEVLVNAAENYLEIWTTSRSSSKCI